jgi:hypothetical protein
MGCCSGDDHKCGCSGEEEQNQEQQDLMNLAFAMDKDMFNEINEAAKANEMGFEEFIYNCIEVGLAISAGELALIDASHLQTEEEEAEEEN